MLKNLWIAAQFLLLEISLAAALQAAILKAGVAKVDITPPAGQPMYGYGSRKSPSISTLDPLYARVLVLDVNGRRLTLVTLDLGQVFGPSSLERLKRVADDSISHLLVVASHTHSGPAIHDEYASGVPAWETAATEKIGATVVRCATPFFWAMPTVTMATSLPSVLPASAVMALPTRPPMWKWELAIACWTVPWFASMRCWGGSLICRKS
jgi:hypothetical protein